MHSICRAPPIFTPASEFATAMPRSLWQCTDQTALSEFGIVLAQVEQELAVELGDGVADRVRNVDRGRAFGDHRLKHPVEEIGLGAVAVLGGNSTSPATVAGEAHRELLCSNTCSRVMRSFFSMCRSLVAMKVWMRARRRPSGASAAREMSRSLARASEHTIESLMGGDRLHGLEIAIARGCEAGLDHIDPQPLELPRDASFSSLVIEAPGDARRRATWCRR